MSSILKEKKEKRSKEFEGRNGKYLDDVYDENVTEPIASFSN
ncbi:12083_t:CDS:2, partial [Entrophospora sp. SA101]